MSLASLVSAVAVLLLLAVSAAVDNLRATDQGYVAEWQWEQWPQQLVPGAINTTRTPGPRQSSALWYDQSAAAWWMFGGRQVPNTTTKTPKIYSDFWRYDTNTRVWARIFPNDSRNNNNGGLQLLRSSLYDEGRLRKKERKESGVVLCARSEGKKMADRSLAIYGPRSARSNTVWQFESKDKLWTTYLCCCDTSDRSNVSVKSAHDSKIASEARNKTAEKMKENKTEKKAKEGKAKASEAMKPMKPGRTKHVKTKVKVKVTTETPDNSTHAQVPVQTQRSNVTDEDDLGNVSEPVASNVYPKEDGEEDFPVGEIIDISGREYDNMTQDVETYLNHSNSRASRDLTKVSEKTAQAFCPDFQASDEPVAWCDVTRELLVAMDVTSSPLVLWQLDLKSSHWTQRQVQVDPGSLWPGCATNSSLRYASAASNVYIVCSPYGQAETTTRLVYRVTADSARLRAVGQLQLNNAFSGEQGEAMWRDETRTVLQAVETELQTLLLIAYDRLLDVWVLESKNKPQGLHILLPVENIWRGSALKWFTGYSAPFYNIQIGGVTHLVPNPRSVEQYWPRDRGSFIVRLLDSDVSGGEVKLSKQAYHVGDSRNLTTTPYHQGPAGLKALCFFAVSLTLFAVFGVVIFVRRCVTCPPRIWRLRGGNEDNSSKPSSPPIIRYSVIPDDLNYPSA